MQLELHAARDAAIDAIRKKYAARQAALGDRLRRAEAAVEKEQQQVSDQKLQTAVSVGATVLGTLFGRKSITVGTLGRATTAARGMGRMMKETSDVKRAAESAASVKGKPSPSSSNRLQPTSKRSARGLASRVSRESPSPRNAVKSKCSSWRSAGFPDERRADARSADLADPARPVRPRSARELPLGRAGSERPARNDDDRPRADAGAGRAGAAGA